MSYDQPLLDVGENLDSCPVALPSFPAENSYSIGDAITFLAQMPDGFLAGVATSPPYNKAFRGRNRNGASTNWPSSRLMESDYDRHDDNLPHEVYVDWQRQFLAEALRVVGDDGVVLYNIGRQIKDLGEDRRQAIIEGFPVRQTIIWNRGSSNNQGGKRPSIFPPIYELVYVLAGRKWRLPVSHLREMRKWGDVWRIPFEINNPHPAPFPVKLALRMVKTIDGPVADPFAGSGTIGIAAESLGMPYFLNDHSPAYKTLYEARLVAHKEGRAWNRA